MVYAEAVPDLDVIQKIIDLKKTKDAIILAHNYQSPEVKFVAEFVGDTLSLAMIAGNLEQRVVIVCGPDFMVETTKILAPDKTVLFANNAAKCPMAGMITLEELRELKKKHPAAKVVGYINTSAECKCEMDICCTSSNAVKITQSLDAEQIIFVPDQNLGSYVQRYVPDKEMIIWPGFCAVHQMILKEDILKLAQTYPKAKIVVHPECTPDVVNMADAVLSTEGMKKYGTGCENREFIVATELELVNAMAEDNPDKQFYAVEKAYCRTQKKVRLNNILEALETLQPEVNLSKEVLRKAKRPVVRMLAAGRGD